MGMVVRTNTMALNAYRQLGMNNSAVAKSLEKLSSGFRINRAGDDAAGLAISEKMKAQITGLETASANAQDGISLIQTAEGNLTEVHSMLNRMVELATKSANGTYTQTERRALQDEVDSLLEEIDRISKSANFNGTNLLDGSLGGINTEAFAIGNTLKATEGSDITSKVTLPADNSSGATNPAFHLGTANVTQVNPSFSIDVADLKLVAKDASKTASITVGGATIDFSGEIDAKDDELTGAALATAIAKSGTAGDDTKYAGLGLGATDMVVEIGGAVFKMTANGTNVNFEYQAQVTGANAAGTVDKVLDDTKAAAINAAIGSAVTVTAATTDFDTTGAVYHNTINVTQAVAEKIGTRAGIDATLTADLVKVGNTLTIEDQTYTFVSWDGKSALGANEIGINSSYDLTKTADQTKAIDDAVNQLSHKETANFRIEAKNGTTIHIDQKTDSTEVYDTEASLKGLFSAKSADQKAGVELTITADKIKDGDMLNVGGKAYKFVETKSSPDAANEIVMGNKGANAIDNLVAALKADGLDVTKDGTKLTIRGDNANITKGGLTLQIGDTADDFNKMNVAVADMSAKGLGLKGLSIMSEKESSDAIAKIKTAINTVSTARAGMGALQNRLEHTINNLDVAVENLSAANSRIRDTDMAKEMMNYTKMNVLVQSAQAMLAQANQQPQSVLQLLQ